MGRCKTLNVFVVLFMHQERGIRERYYKVCACVYACVCVCIGMQIAQIV